MTDNQTAPPDRRWVRIPHTPGDSQPRLSDGIYRGVRSDGDGGFWGLPIEAPSLEQPEIENLKPTQHSKEFRVERRGDIAVLLDIDGPCRPATAAEAAMAAEIERLRMVLLRLVDAAECVAPCHTTNAEWDEFDAATEAARKELPRDGEPASV